MIDRLKSLKRAFVKTLIHLIYNDRFFVIDYIAMNVILFDEHFIEKRGEYDEAEK